MKIQVLLSTYNGEKFLTEQIESIMQQNGVDVTLLIRDDGSVDGTINILKTIQKKYPNKIEIIEGQNVGVTESFFELLKFSNNSNEYYAFADQDDVWLENKLEIACNTIEKQINSDKIPFLYVGNYTLVNSELEIINVANAIERKIDYPMTLVENIALGCTMVMNKSLRDEIICKKTPPAIIHDWYVYLLAQTIGNVFVDERPTMLYRQHSNNVIGNRKQGIKENFKKFLAISTWAKKNKQQLKFIECNYLEKAHSDKMKILQEYIDISNQPLRKRIHYNKTRRIRRSSLLHDIILSIYILLKKI